MFPEAVPLLEATYQQWTLERNYLGIDATHYDVSCPPLMYMGGNGLVADSAPLVVISIEPLKHHQDVRFEAQAQFARTGLSQYVEWNLDYFRRFPQLMRGFGVQSYFSNLDDFVAGWADVHPVPDPPWPLLGQHMIEVPFVPMHARGHNRHAFEGARERLADLLSRRLELILQRWPNACFVALGAFADWLETIVTPPSRVDHVYPTATQEEFGIHYFDVPWEERRLVPLGNRLLLVRRGPLSNRQNPKAPGRRALGRWARSYLESRQGPVLAASNREP